MGHEGIRQARPCIWMSAGLVAYRLCDRDFDCEHCPLDAALRGGAGPGGTPARAGTAHAGVAVEFPADRRYSDRHLWLRTEEEGTARIGLDAFAARLIGRPRAITFAAAGSDLGRDETMCALRLEGGSLPVAAPLPGVITEINADLQSDAGAVEREPYGAGWLAALSPSRSAAAEAFLDETGAATRAELDLRRFRRLAAMRLLAETEQVGPTLADGGARIWDVRAMLGPRTYLAVLAELFG
jgi:glycine cleavage system H protein